MASRQTKQAKVDALAHQRLIELQQELPRHGFPANVDYADILSAMALYTNTAQLAGMLREYWRYTDELARSAASSPRDTRKSS